jgi:phage terminase large subunit-like protein
VLATKQGQAREVVEAAKAIAENDPRLVTRMAWYEDDGELVYRPTGARMVAHSARLRSIEGLRYRLALIDEIGFALDELVTSIVARLGKGNMANRILGMGTPGFEPNVLHRIREMSRDGTLPAGAAYLEWAAPDGVDVTDERAWREANPAVAAGFLSPATRELQIGLMPERQFRVYHFGQWVESSSGWLPPGAWQACPHVGPPPPGAEVVLAVEGTYKRTLAVVGAALDGSVFLVWAAEAAPDGELRDVLAAACERWQVAAVVHNRRIRVRLFDELTRDGMPLEPWTGTAEVEAASANELWRAITDGRVPHDHDPVVAAHMANLGARWMSDGSLRLSRRDESGDCDAALAVRMAWWRATRIDPGSGETPRIY